MRIRSIRPEFWSSEDVAAMDWFTRLVFVGLWSYVDDNGVGRGVEQLIVAALFPLDGDLPEASRRVTGALYHLSEHGQITRYEVDGKRYLHITAWEKHQRIEKRSTGRYPLPTSENANLRKDSPTTPVALREPSTPGEGEKGRRGEEQTPSSAAADAPTDPFDEWWALYPKKVEKVDARKAWGQVAKKGVKPEQLIEAVKRYPFPDDRQFVKHPAVWLRKGAYEDHLQPTLRGISGGAERAWTAAELDQVLGVDFWRLPPYPDGMDADEQWEWEQRVRLSHRAERVRQAEAKLGRSA